MASVPCACRDCFNIATGDDMNDMTALCLLCEAAGCIPGDGECLVEQWYEAMEME